MSFEPRVYPDIVRDFLTLLTGGTVAESIPIGPDGPGDVRLAQAPVQRVSHLEGTIALGEKMVPYRFTERDFQLVGTDERPNELSSVRFRNKERLPAPGSILNYPLRLPPTPLSDVNVGSVVRTLLETVAWELAAQYQQLDRVYRSAFVETADGTSLEKVVALVDVRRLEQGHPIGRVRFGRRAGSPGLVFIPANTAVTDGKGARYLTSTDGEMLPSQSSIDIWVRGESPRTKIVKAGELSVLERAIAGVDRVSNAEDMFRATEAERDDQLQQRARRAIHGTGRGTLDAIKYALESLPFVSGVSLTERPDGVPGTLRVDVALTEDNAQRRAQIEQVVRDFRPAGIFVDLSYAGRVVLAAHLTLTLAGRSLPTSDVVNIQDGVFNRLDAAVKGLAPGGVLRKARLLASLLEDQRIVDVVLSMTADGTPIAGDAFTLPASKSAKIEKSGVSFDKIRFETEPSGGGPRTTQVDLDFVVAITDDSITDTSALEPVVRVALAPLLKNLGPGGSLSFDAVLDALRSDTRFVVSAASSSLELVLDTGAFTELRNSDSPYVLAEAETLNLRAVRLSKDES